VKVVVTGASGNVGTSVLRALGDEPSVSSILGLARRVPAQRFAKTEWAPANVVSSDLARLFEGADAVIHLAWLIQPGRDEKTTRAANVDGSARVFAAAADAGVSALVHASSVGAYSAGPKDRAVDESWPTEGIPSSFYSRHKAECERLLDRFETDNPHIRVVRLRPGLIFKRDAATGIRRLFAGPFLPNPLVRRSLIPVVPDVKGLRFQAVHSHDVGDAYRLAVTRDVKGPFNVAAEPVLDPEQLAHTLGARRVPVPATVLRAGAALSFRARLQPTEPGWLDMALGVPIMDAARARDELGWTPRHTSEQALLDLIEGMGDGAGIDTPPLAPSTSGPFRVRELLTGLGRRSGV
jgi:nucleoside-diphosphate-sugar epimerase